MYVCNAMLRNVMQWNGMYGTYVCTMRIVGAHKEVNEKKQLIIT